MSEEPFTFQIPRLASPPSDAAYDSIRAVVAETERGRWFLEEYARRSRTTGAEAGLAAIQRLETILGEGATQSFDQLRSDLVEMAQAIRRTKTEIAALKPQANGGGGIENATGELDSIVQTTERAASRILAAAEQVQEIAWTLREKGTDAALCDQLDAEAIEIYTACSFQDLTGQRTRQVVQVLRYLEHRINAMIDIWGKDVPAAPAGEQTGDAALINGPSPAGMGVNQADVDAIMQPTDADDRQDATVEDISRFMAALAPLMAIHEEASGAADLVAAEDHAAEFPAEPVPADATAEAPPAGAMAATDERLVTPAETPWRLMPIPELNFPALPAEPNIAPVAEAAPSPAAPQTEADDFLFMPAPSYELPAIAPKHEPGQTASAEASQTAPTATATIAQAVFENVDPADFLLEPAAGGPAREADGPVVAMPSVENPVAAELSAADATSATQPPEFPPTPMRSEVVAEAAVFELPTNLTPAAASRPASKPTRTPNDPLAPLRALSDEEKIALFT
jgi:chemotaxis regulatin CheY-phosphate phosphatase CheZ